MGISTSTVQRALTQAKLRTRRARSLHTSNAPEFEREGRRHHRAVHEIRSSTRPCFAWFDVIARGVFTSRSRSKPQLMKYVRSCAQRARLIRWTYPDPQRRIAAKRITGTIRELRRTHPEVKILALSGAFGGSDLKLASTLGCKWRKRSWSDRRFRK